ncbi:hypothetical protein K9L97_00730 [Candidatus Woesearchaeota archaeon]|nr:hypothetical protein [Candidatus Woesearchaeota archaeon]
MRKKEEESIIRRTVGVAARSFKRAILGSEVGKVVEEIKEEIDETIELTKKRVDKLVFDIASHSFSLLIVAVGVLLAFLGVAYFLIDVLFVPRSASFIFVGVVLLLFGYLSLRNIRNLI